MSEIEITPSPVQNSAFQEITPSPSTKSRKIYNVFSPRVNSGQQTKDGIAYIQKKLDEKAPGEYDLVTVTNVSSLQFGLQPIVYWYDGSETDRSSFSTYGVDSDSIWFFINTTITNNSQYDFVASGILSRLD